MGVKITLPYYFSKYTEGSDHIQIESGKISEIFQNIKKKYPKLAEKLFDKSGFLNPYFKLFLLNDPNQGVSRQKENVCENIADYNKEIKDNQSLRIVLLVLGG